MAGASSREQIIGDIKNLLWGPGVKEDVFQRWAQGFYFSAHENTALIQAEGGPCAVLAPLQAFILKQLFAEPDVAAWRSLQPEACDRLLVQAMTEILGQAADPDNPGYSVLLVDGPLLNGEVPAEELSPSSPMEVDSTSQPGPTVGFKVFHSRLRILTLDSIEEVERFLTENISVFKEQFGVLLLLYSVICTKGIPQMQSEISDTTDPLIESTFGHGSQSLINLMLSGKAVSNVLDHEKDVGGLRLKGIDKQNTVGFLTVLEIFKFIEVGMFLKSPLYPIWLLASETHLSVLFSFEKKLVSPETPADQARRVFKKYDNDGNNFIPTEALKNVLVELGLFSDDEYIEIMKNKLDGDNCGIILLTPFMYEFFPEEVRAYPDTFVLYHYNGLPRSNPDKKVKYHRGQAILLESTVSSVSSTDHMMTVLQTKWPSIEVQWDFGRIPSIN